MYFIETVVIHPVNYYGHACRYCCVFKTELCTYLAVCLHCFTVVHVQKILLPCLDLLMIVPVLSLSCYHKCFGLLLINVSFDMGFTNLG